MVERSIHFDRAGHSLDAVQRAAYRFSDRMSCDIGASAETIDVGLHIADDQGDVDALVASFRNEVLDQALRERIRAETADVRNLVLALAFSKTGLTEADV